MLAGLSIFIIVYFIILLFIEEFRLLINFHNNYHSKKSIKFNTNQTEMRKYLLKINQIYMEPYTDIWNNQTIKNDNIVIILKDNKITIKNNLYIAVIRARKNYFLQLIWNYILKNFNRHLTYNELTDLIKNARFWNNITFTYTDNKPCNSYQSQLIDINNCSENEISKLAGINIVLAKKIVKKRIEISGFSTKQEFFDFINVKPHLKRQIEKKIIIKKVCIRKPLRLINERIIDI